MTTVKLIVWGQADTDWKQVGGTDRVTQALSPRKAEHVVQFEAEVEIDDAGRFVRFVKQDVIYLDPPGEKL